MDNHRRLFPFFRNLFNRLLFAKFLPKSVSTLQGWIWYVQCINRSRNGIFVHYHWRTSQWQIWKEEQDDKSQNLHDWQCSWITRYSGLHSSHWKLPPLYVRNGGQILGVWVLDVPSHYHDAIYCEARRARQHCQRSSFLSHHRRMLLNRFTGLGRKHSWCGYKSSYLWKIDISLVHYWLCWIDSILLESG